LNAASIAAQYGSTRHSGKKDGNVMFRIPCPAHGGKKPNLAIWDGDNGRLGAKRHSH